jgi:TatD DNase family protein
MFVDTHTHLFYPNFSGELDEILDRAKASGVDYMLIPAVDLASSVQAVELAEKYKEVYAAVGVHPHDVKEWDDSLIKEIETLAQSKKVAAIGEIGLDYYYDFSPRDIQIKALEAQLELALKLKLPVIVHNREASKDILEIFRKYSERKLQAQFHCFSGSLAEAKELIEMKYYISFTGNITYKKADNLREVVKNIQVDDMLLETDSPFMAPGDQRGKRNEPAFIKMIAEMIAELQHISVEDVARTTSVNAHTLYGIGKKPPVSYTYKIGDALYINVTNRCDSDCVFCDRKGNAIIKGYNLKMSKSEEPPAEKYIQEIGDPKKYKEIVFCGYGEPTIRWDVVKQVAKYVKDNGGKTRMNTDGHGNYINKRDITPELKGLIDAVSISLNSTNAEEYARLMNIDPKLHAEMMDFARKAKKYTKTVMSVVGLSSVDIENARKFVHDEIGVEFRERAYF